MEANYEFLDVFSRRYIRLANALRGTGDIERADAFGAMGSVMHSSSHAQARGNLLAESSSGQ